MFTKNFSLLLSLACASTLPAADKDSKWTWPEGVDAVKYLSAADNTEQNALFYKPENKKQVPLLVALHTWSSDYLQPETGYAQWCVAKGWAFIHPDFRGPNIRPQATGSELVVEDIVSAVEYAKKNAYIDSNRIYLIGASGGGYATLLLAGRHPEIWAGASAWVPIFDLEAWHNECKKVGSGYFKGIADSCGGAPGMSKEVDEQYKKRSACTYLHKASSVPLDINAGIQDGHKGSVPISHSLMAFNALADAKDRISDEDIKFMVDKIDVPEHLKKDLSDSLYGKRMPLFRRVSNNARVTIFQGGHEIIQAAGLTWLEQQRKNSPAVWDFDRKDQAVKFSEKEIQSGK